MDHIEFMAALRALREKLASCAIASTNNKMDHIKFMAALREKLASVAITNTNNIIEDTSRVVLVDEVEQQHATVEESTNTNTCSDELEKMNNNRRKNTNGNRVTSINNTSTKTLKDSTSDGTNGNQYTSRHAGQAASVTREAGQAGGASRHAGQAASVTRDTDQAGGEIIPETTEEIRKLLWRSDGRDTGSGDNNPRDSYMDNEGNRYTRSKVTTREQRGGDAEADSRNKNTTAERGGVEGSRWNGSRGQRRGGNSSDWRSERSNKGTTDMLTANGKVRQVRFIDNNEEEEEDESEEEQEELCWEETK
jgi:hypothetical protein